MKTIEIPMDDPLEMIWAIRRKIHEETKDMTPEEKSEYTQQKVESFHRRMEQPPTGKYDFSFLYKKKVENE